MRSDPQYWYEAGKTDRAAGNDVPAVTDEDFYRELETADAKVCADAYKRGFKGE